MDPYHVLGVPPGATDSEIKAAYRKAAMRWHPDRNTASGPEAAAIAERQFKAVNDAYDYLSNSGGRGPGPGSSASGGGAASADCTGPQHPSRAAAGRRRDLPPRRRPRAHGEG